MDRDPHDLITRVLDEFGEDPQSQRAFDHPPQSDLAKQLFATVDAMNSMALSALQAGQDIANLEKPTRAELLIECERLKGENMDQWARLLALESRTGLEIIADQEVMIAGLLRKVGIVGAALSDLWSLVQSYEECVPTRDLPLHESELIDASVRENTAKVLAEVQA